MDPLYERGKGSPESTASAAGRRRRRMGAVVETLAGDEAEPVPAELRTGPLDDPALGVPRRPVDEMPRRAAT